MNHKIEFEEVINTIVVNNIAKQSKAGEGSKTLDLSTNLGYFPESVYLVMTTEPNLHVYYQGGNIAKAIEEYNKIIL